MKREYWLYAVVAALFVGIGVYLGAKGIEPAASAPPAVSQFFALSLPDATGQVQHLSQWKDKVLIINFWATWCAPCVQEMPELSELNAQVRTKNIQIVGIGIDSASNISEFSTKHKIAYPLYAALKSGTDLSRQFGNQVGGLPFTVLVGKDGKVKKTYLGRLKIDELRKDLVLF